MEKNVEVKVMMVCRNGECRHNWVDSVPWAFSSFHEKYECPECKKVESKVAYMMEVPA